MNVFWAILAYLIVNYIFLEISNKYLYGRGSFTNELIDEIQTYNPNIPGYIKWFGIIGVLFFGWFLVLIDIFNGDV